MRFAEINLFGVYIAPISLMMALTWILLTIFHRIADHFGLMRYIWHPALFSFAVYIVMLSSIILFVAR
jgi:hypothetical protein